MEDEDIQLYKIEFDKLKELEKEFYEAINKRNALFKELKKDINVYYNLHGDTKFDFVFKLEGTKLVKHDLEDAKRLITISIVDLRFKLAHVMNLICTLRKEKDTQEEMLNKTYDTLFVPKNTRSFQQLLMEASLSQ